MPKILIVEDEVGMAQLIKQILTRKGYDVAVASTGKEALLGNNTSILFKVQVSDSPKHRSYIFYEQYQVPKWGV